MSTGKRLAKRSIVGTRVCAPGDDDKYYSGVIIAVKTPANAASSRDNANCIHLTPNTRYTVRFDASRAVGKRAQREFRDVDLIGPGFRSMMGLRLLEGQRVFLTYNGREVSGQVVRHADEDDEVVVKIAPVGCEPLETVKRLEELRLLESRKSARLADTDTDFARLADMATERTKRQQQQYPASIVQHMQHHNNTQGMDISASQIHGSRKRRPSQSHEDLLFSRSVGEDSMDECNAALVLMSLSCSPHSPHNVAATWGGRRCPASPAASCSDSSWRSSSGTPSPPLTPPHPQNLHQNAQQSVQLNNQATAWGLQFTQTPHQQSLQQNLQHSINLHDYSKKSAPNSGRNHKMAMGSDEGIVSDYDEADRSLPRKKRASSLVFQCTWPGCGNTDVSRKSIEQHVRQVHLGPKTSSSSSGSPDSGISGSGGSSRRRSRRHSRRRRRASSLGDDSDRTAAAEDSRLSDDRLSDNEEDGNVDEEDDDSSSSCCSSDHEEEFYYTEVERCDAGRPAPPSPPTLSHRDMARPPHEDPEYQKKIVGSLRQGLLMCKPINIPSGLQHQSTAAHMMNSTPPQKHVRLSPRPSTSYAPYPIPQSTNHHHLNGSNNNNSSPNLQAGGASALSHSAPSRYSHGAPLSPSRRTRGENKKCRKVYGMEHRDQWCTQCKWKKACSRFGD